MKLAKLLIVFLFLFNSCKENNKTVKEDEVENDISSISTKDFREFKVLDSKYISNTSIWEQLNSQLEDFSEENYEQLKPLILDQDIPTLQQHIIDGKLTYERLTKFYLFRIRKFDRENDLALNSVIAVNPNVIMEARVLDEVDDQDINLRHAIYGMPILLKDNINTSDMVTTAGAVALKNNKTEDASIVKRLKEKGALILGKANLSEWAYFFCGDCPSGYSAIGGQTLNPYGRRVIDTGGSSSGSGVAVAANFCVAAVGSETAGSILSPASQNSVVGLKPTIGIVSRSGIVPISSTLDTAGPMSKNVIDNAILLDALVGFDAADSKSIETGSSTINYDELKNISVEKKRLGAIKSLMKDSLYLRAVNDLKTIGFEVVEIEMDNVELPDFIRLLNLDMQKDLPEYFNTYADASLGFKTIDDIIDFNKKDSLNIMPYGQKLFEGVVADKASVNELESIKEKLKTNGKLFFDKPMEASNLDVILSINNYHAAHAAVAEYPALTVPMGYAENGAPKGITFIGKPLTENQLLQIGFAFENKTKYRQSPKELN
ncbi:MULTISPECIES: amidase family protein [Mesoflavibacter]|uniref:amidase family protein n=1 Tax=Mesoflavibacter TaxID=444051 RepID=UPI000D11236D|nr:MULTISPECIES: amidase family protein [Mesoflavibacter]QIJ89710.1 Amidase family protein [Mesoflavibacter sp. HG96]QIJ92438.1 Amidase family protein [Mesoflavibacter sp. HG37]